MPIIPDFSSYLNPRRTTGFMVTGTGLPFPNWFLERDLLITISFYDSVIILYLRKLLTAFQGVRF